MTSSGKGGNMSSDNPISKVNSGDSSNDAIDIVGEINSDQGIIPVIGEYLASPTRNSYTGSGEQIVSLLSLEELVSNLKASNLREGNHIVQDSSKPLIQLVNSFTAFTNSETSNQENLSLGKAVDTIFNTLNLNNSELSASVNESLFVESSGNSHKVLANSSNHNLLANSSNEPNTNSNDYISTTAETFPNSSNSTTPNTDGDVFSENPISNSVSSQPTQPEENSSRSNLDLSGLVEGVDYARSEVIVKFKAGTLSTQMSALQQSLGVRVLETTQTSGTQLWTIEGGMSVEQVIAALDRNPQLEYVEPNYILSANLIPNDTDFDQLWGLNNTGQTGGTPDADIDAPEAWDITTGNGQVVGVIDSGVDYTHPDLVNNIWINPGEIANNGIDDDGNGYIDDVHGYDFVNNDGDPMDDDSHGTHVAGTIAAEGNNSLGVIGVAPNTQIMALKFLDNTGSGSTFDAIQAIEYATMMKLDYGVNINITNNSWGGGGFSQALSDAIAAAGAAGQLFIAAAGNSGVNNDSIPHYPSNYNLDNIISVAATDHNDQLAGFSNFGATSVDLGAPGVNILSTVPGGGYASFNGTSMAAPHVAGVAALLLSQDSTLTALDVKDRILSYVDPIEALQGNTVTGGRLNANNALTQTQPLSGELSGNIWNDLNGNGVQDAGELGLEGWTVYLDQNQNGNLDNGELSTVTDVNGDYSFLSLAPGTYTVAEVLMPGWGQTYPGFNGGFETGNFSSWQTVGDTSIETAGFGSSPTEGTYQALLTNGGGSVSDTDLETFLGLTLGSLDGLGNGDATEGTAIKQTVTVSAGTQLSFDWNFLTNEDTPSNTFNDFSFVSIVSNTLDTLADTNDAFVTSATSFNQETGFNSFSYTFSTAGTYTIGVGVVDVQDTSIPSALLVDNFSFTGNVSTEGGNYTMFVGSGDTVSNIDFGNQELTNVSSGEIHGSKWNDSNGNGVWDAGELGLEGWTIYLDQNNNGELDNGEQSTITDANGNYSFLNLAPDTYTVAEVLIPGWEQTYPTSFEYQWSDSNQTGGPVFDWLDISSLGTALNLSDDDFAEVSLPFDFSFYGDNKNTVKISSNGYLTFGSDGTDFSNDPIPDINDPNDIIAPFWDDLNPSAGGSIYHYYDASEEQFIVQYEDVPLLSGGGSLTFQAILDSDGSILFQYEDLNGTLDSATIGIENATGDKGVQVAYNETYVANDLAVSIIPVPPGSHTVELDAGEIVTDINFGNQQISPSNIFGTPNPDELNIVESPVIVFAGDGNDIVDGSQSPGGNRYYGGNGDDIIWASVYDRLFGENGNDTLYAGDGNSILNGGADADQFWIALAALPSAVNTIADFEDGVDLIGIGGLGITFNELTITQNGNDALISALGQDLAILTGIQTTTLDSTDFVFA